MAIVRSEETFEKVVLDAEKAVAGLKQAQFIGGGSVAGYGWYSSNQYDVATVLNGNTGKFIEVVYTGEDPDEFVQATLSMFVRDAANVMASPIPPISATAPVIGAYVFAYPVEKGRARWLIRAFAGLQSNPNPTGYFKFSIEALQKGTLMWSVQ